MQADNKHQFLRRERSNAAYNLPSNALDRIICRGMGQDTRAELATKPLMRLVNSEALMTCSDVDVTTAIVAYGRRAIPKLKKELLNPDPMVSKRAIMSLLDMVHDLEKAVEAVRLQVVPRLVRLMRSEDPFVRQHVLLILQTLARQPSGKVTIVNHNIVMSQLASSLSDEDYSVRKTAAKTLLALATWYFGVTQLIDNSFIPIVTERLNTEQDGDVVETLLETLELLLDHGSAAKEQGLQVGGLELAILLVSHAAVKVRSLATAVLTQLLQHPDGKTAVLHQLSDVLATLTELLEDEDDSVRTHAAGALMFALCTTEAKLRCLRLHTLHRLLHCAELHLAPALQLNAIKALTSLAESPQGRATLKSVVAQVQDIRPADGIVVMHKQILLTVINKVI